MRLFSGRNMVEEAIGGIWMQILGPLTVFEDNMACIIYYSRNPGAHQRTKHIDQKYHFVREQVEAGNIILQKNQN